MSLSKHLAHNLGNLLLLGKIGVFHNRRNASSRLLLLISKHLILCIYLVFRMQGVEFDNGDMYVDGHKAASDVRDEFVSVTEKLMDELRSEERFSRNAETDLVCRLLLEKKKSELQKYVEKGEVIKRIEERLKVH